MECKFIKAWSGRCLCETVADSEYCNEHSDLKCCSCGDRATRQCDETGQFVCGAPLCDNCEHTIAEDGTNGGIGFFRSSPLPEGYNAHCKKGEQVYTPWYTRDDLP